MASSELSSESLERTIEELRSGALDGSVGEKYVTLVRTEDLRVSIAARRQGTTSSITWRCSFAFSLNSRGRK